MILLAGGRILRLIQIQQVGAKTLKLRLSCITAGYIEDICGIEATLSLTVLTEARSDENLIKGTRTQNVGANDGKGGMAYTERKVVNYLYSHHRVSVYYSTKPIYKDKELVPRSVIVDVKSSDGKINERVIVYNAAKGFKINYK